MESTVRTGPAEDGLNPRKEDLHPKPTRFRVNVNLHTLIGALLTAVVVCVAAIVAEEHSGLPEAAWALAGLAVGQCFGLAKDMVNKRDPGLDD